MSQSADDATNSTYDVTFTAGPTYGDTTYTVYAVASPPAPSGHHPTVAEIVRGECGPQFRHHPDLVSDLLPGLVLIAFIVAAAIDFYNCFTPRNP